MSIGKVSTNGMFRSYREHLDASTVKMQKSMDRVSLGRNFNTFAEDPASASKAFQLRRTFWRTSDSIDSSNHLISKFDTAYQAASAIVDGDLETPGLNGIAASIRAMSDTSAAGRRALGIEIAAEANSAMQSMNSKYGNEYVFAGADALNVPFRWSEDGTKLLYRGVDVSAPEGSEEGRLLRQYIEQDKGTFSDIGLGVTETADGEIVESSVFPSAVSGAEFLGYGVDEDGDSKNALVLMRELGELYQRCDEDTGYFASDADKERAGVLNAKLQSSLSQVQEQHVYLSANTGYLKTNLKQLEDSNYAVNEEIADVEQADPALAITEMLWATYCYQAALRVGNDVLTESLFDYMR